MRLRIYNVRILTMETGVPVFRGEIQTEGSEISYIGEERLMDDSVCFDRQIDGRGNLIMPGFKNAHAHSPMTFLRSFADDLPLERWLAEVVFPAEAKLTQEDTYWLSMLAYMEYLTSGITAAFDMYFLREGAARAAVDMGYRLVLCGAVNQFCESIEAIEADYLKYQKEHPLLSFRLGFHAVYTADEELLKGMAGLARKYGEPVFTHIAETEGEVRTCRERTGMTPAVYMDSFGMFEYGGGGFHMVHLEEEDYELIRKRKLFCITNPAANLKLASGIAPIARLLREGAAVAIGTDGPAGNNCLDMFREMFLVTGLQKAVTRDAAAVPAEEVLHMATVNGALAMGLSNSDILKAGKHADFIMIDLNQPNMQPVQEDTIVKNLVYSGSKQNVKMTVIHGKILYENAQFSTGILPEEVYHQVGRIVSRVFL